MSEPIRHVFIRGRVQGVGYRAWVAAEADVRGVAGWVRNRRDGTVEAVFIGRTDVVDAMLAACRIGPPLARVDTIDATEADESTLRLHESDVRFAVLATL